VGSPCGANSIVVVVVVIRLNPVTDTGHYLDALCIVLLPLLPLIVIVIVVVVAVFCQTCLQHVRHSVLKFGGLYLRLC